MMATRLTLAAALMTLALAGASADEQASTGFFEGHGVVKAVAPKTGALTIAHDDIKGFMPAMEMMYGVSSPDLAGGLHPGDVIDFTIDAEKYLIVGVRRVGHRP